MWRDGDSSILPLQPLRPENWQRFRTESLIGATLAGEKKYVKAERMLLDGYQGILARKDPIALPINIASMRHSNGSSSSIRTGGGLTELRNGRKMISLQLYNSSRSKSKHGTLICCTARIRRAVQVAVLIFCKQTLRRSSVR